MGLYSISLIAPKGPHPLWKCRYSKGNCEALVLLMPFCHIGSSPKSPELGLKFNLRFPLCYLYCAICQNKKGIFLPPKCLLGPTHAIFAQNPPPSQCAAVLAPVCCPRRRIRHLNPLFPFEVFPLGICMSLLLLAISFLTIPLIGDLTCRGVAGSYLPVWSFHEVKPKPEKCLIFFIWEYAAAFIFEVPRNYISQYFEPFFAPLRGTSAR